MMADLAYDVALEAAHYLAPCFAFCGSSGYIGFGFFVVSHTDDGGPVERGIRLAVAASVQAHAEGLSPWLRSRNMWWDGLASDCMFLYCSAMPARWKSDRPMSRQQFEALFPDDAACARYLVGRRWPDGFVCPVCGVCKGWGIEP